MSYTCLPELFPNRVMTLVSVLQLLPMARSAINLRDLKIHCFSLFQNFLSSCLYLHSPTGRTTDYILSSLRIPLFNYLNDELC